ncbi:MAG TPA: NAD-dependent epimerase/dehydratase family protein [Verrucomicrobiae bacterium]
MMSNRIHTEEELDEVLTRPGPALIEFIRKVPSPLMVLGAGGKMGSTVAVLAKRAAEAANMRTEIVAVSRFSDSSTRQKLEDQGVRTLSVDLLERDNLRELPDAENIIHLAGLKFGTAENPAMTWAVNTLVPAHVAGRYPSARIVALSTGNVYPHMPIDSSGASEIQPVRPLGDYATAAVARERVFTEASEKNGCPVAIIRLNYAVELRYGVLVDIARKVWAGEPIEVSNGWFNCIWQGDACDMVLRALPLAARPPTVWNLTSSAKLSVHTVANQFSELFGRPAKFIGEESDTAFLSNPAKLFAELGAPPTPLDVVIRWTAEWVRRGGRLLNKPTRFEVRDGRY